MLTAHGKKFFIEFHKDQSCCAYFQYFFAWLILFPQRRTMPYSSSLVIKEIEEFSEVLLKWCDYNYMKIYSGKSHVLYSGNDNIDDHIMISQNKNELLGIILGSKLSFEDHINSLCKKASQISTH